MAHKLVSVLLASSALLFGGICFADSSVETTINLVDFDQSTEIVVGSTPGGVTGDFRRTLGTLHMLSKPGQLPPGPCKLLTKAWDFQVNRDRPNARLALSGLLTVMAQANCPVTIEITTASPADGGLPELKSIRPGK